MSLIDSAAAEFRRLLLDELMPFWFRHGVDREFGGVLSVMHEDGRQLSTDKYLWSQGRWLWVVSAVYNRLDRRPEFLQSARDTARFLLDHGRDDQDRWYFAVTRSGQPLIGPTSIYADCFAIYGLSEYYRATREPVALDTALRAYTRVRNRVEQPDFNEVAPATLNPGRRAHAVPMILTEVANELAQTTGDASIEAAADEYASRVLRHFVRPERRALLEYLDWDYQPLPGPEGTAVEPGHAIESMWFILHWALRRGDEAAIAQAIECIRWHCELGWDPEYGGLCLAVDIDGHPPYLDNADKKIWWVHTEALYALLLAYKITGASWCADWYERIHQWSLKHFYMPEAGEWRQRLDRSGRPITELIALPVKDPFHLPRAALLIARLSENRNAENRNAQKP
ncbi:MAG: AGE family epimerase/isomerase [Bryobacterales bacterium]|nr:AGE family epimerase/isomerase [Bryobacterales bacterium]